MRGAWEAELVMTIKEIRIQTGLSRKEFCERFSIPLRTMEEWEAGRRNPPEYIPRMLAYYVQMLYKEQKKDNKIIMDPDGRKIVLVNEIRFKGKRKINWKEVKEYLTRYIGNCYEIESAAEKIYIGNEFPEEFTESESRKALMGANAKAKANSATIIPELIQIAENPQYEKNRDEAGKHIKNAKNGWYRYDVRFAMPVYDEEILVRYNIYKAKLLINHASNGKKYLYDILSIKKETSKPQQ